MRAEAVSAFVQAPAHVVVEARLCYFLDEMAHCLDHAHMADRGSAGLHMLLGVAYAKLAALPDAELFRTTAIGASFRTGPYAGLSVVASMLVNTNKRGMTRHRCAYAELTLHARDLLHGVSPFADEMMHARFQDAHDRLASKLTKESNIR